MSDWHKCTDEEAALIASCGPDETCILFEGTLVKLSRARLTETLGSAFREAITTALERAGISTPGELADYAVEPYDAETGYVRVTVTAKDGRSASATGALPDPRAVH